MLEKEMPLKMFDAALQASLPKNFIHKYCRLEKDVFIVKEERYPLNKYKNIYLFGSGKASVSMAIEVEKILGEQIKQGLLIAPEGTNVLKYTDVLVGSHPLPSEKSIIAGQRLYGAMQECEEDDLYIYLLSGGSSALVEIPLEEISLEDIQKSTDLMLKNGLSIQEINKVRKHLSQIKGGKLAKANKAIGIVLVLSDVLGDDLESIGSGLLYRDSSTFVDAKKTLEEKNIFSLLPLRVQNILQKGVDAKIEETPKIASKNVKHFILASNSVAVQSAKECAQKFALKVEIADTPMKGDVVAMSQKIKEITLQSRQESLIFGGECTVNMHGKGKGGRNQHMAGLMLQEICKGDLDICFFISSDGWCRW